MKARAAVVGVGVLTVLSVAAAPALATAGWSGNGAGKTAAKAGSLAAPTALTITSCTATAKSGQNITVTVVVTWTKSTSPASGQKVSQGVDSQTIADNTTQTATFTGLVRATGSSYSFGLIATAGTAWKSANATSNKSFSVTTSGSNGTCTIA